MQHPTRHGSQRWFVAAALLVCASSAAAQVTTRSDTVGRLLNLWFNEGSAAGLSRLTYENRDGGHSALHAAEWPQLRVYSPTETEKAAGHAPGLATAVRPFPLIGNASMAAPADKGGSIPRLYELDGSGLPFLARQYLNNNLFVYPSHQDHLPGRNGVGGWGDLYPSNTACVLISQGSSGTDQPFLRAFLAAAAALPPDTQRRLISGQILMPTLQALFRRNLRPVTDEATYFTGVAHPPVFRSEDIDEERFVRAAHNLTEFAIPPVVMLETISEGPAPVNGRDFFELPVISGEKLGETPGTIARVFRGSDFRRQIVVSARRSFALSGTPLEFRWVVLQGDPRRIAITPANGGSEARIDVAWHPEMRSAAGLASHRVDIGVFATNGLNWSAPAFVTFLMLPNEARYYRENGQIEEICYEAANPHVGLPAADDPRWLALGHKLTHGDASPGIRLLRESLPAAVTKALQAAAAELAPAQQAWRTLAEDETKTSEAAAASASLRSRIAGRMNAATPAGPTLRDEVERTVQAIADRPELLVSLEAGTPKPDSAGAAADLAAAKQRALDGRVLLEVERGVLRLRAAPEMLTRGDRTQLRALHLTFLATSLLPDFLERSNKPAFADPRLTASKNWRDLHHYDGEGRHTGWTRITNGREYAFDADGRLLPDGPGGRAVGVTLRRDNGTGRLIFAPR